LDLLLSALFDHDEDTGPFSKSSMGSLSRGGGGLGGGIFPSTTSRKKKSKAKSRGGGGGAESPTNVSDEDGKTRCQMFASYFSILYSLIPQQHPKNTLKNTNTHPQQI